MGIAILHLKPECISIKRQTSVQVSDEQHRCHNIANHGVYLSSFFVESDIGFMCPRESGPSLLVQAPSASVLDKHQCNRDGGTNFFYLALYYFHLSVEANKRRRPL